MTSGGAATTLRIGERASAAAQQAPMEIDRSHCGASRHGDEAAYGRARCRCADALNDARIKAKRRREGRAVRHLVSAVGATRRLRALAALGWTLDAIAAQSAVPRPTLDRLQRGVNKTVTRPVAASVHAVYDQLAMRLGPSELTRQRSAAKHWPPPLAWDDAAIDDPTRPPTEIPEQAPDVVAEAEWLASFGVSDHESATRLGIKVSHLQRRRKRRHRKQAAELHDAA